MTDPNKLGHAKQGSLFAKLRLMGMKARAGFNPPTAATGKFPYPHHPASITMHWPKRRKRSTAPRGRPPKRIFPKAASEYGLEI